MSRVLPVLTLALCLAAFALPAVAIDVSASVASLTNLPPITVTTSVTVIFNAYNACLFSQSTANTLGTASTTALDLPPGSTIANVSQVVSIPGVNVRNTLGIGVTVSATTNGVTTFWIDGCQLFTCTGNCSFNNLKPHSMNAGQDTTLQYNLTLKNGKPYPTPNPCFPGSALVELRDGSKTPLHSLRVGTEVRVASGSGPEAFSPVYFFGHRLPTAVDTFVRIVTDSGREIALSPSHFIYVLTGGKKRAVPARAARVGHVVLAGDDGRPLRVVKIHNVVMDGIYNPHTLHGDIVVDGVLASSYTEACPAWIAHGLLAPVRMWWRLTGGVFAALEAKSAPSWVHALLRNVQKIVA